LEPVNQMCQLLQLNSLIGSDRQYYPFLPPYQ
jgi:hypothetical protein